MGIRPVSDHLHQKTFRRAYDHVHGHVHDRVHACDGGDHLHHHHRRHHHHHRHHHHLHRTTRQSENQHIIVQYIQVPLVTPHL